MKIFIKLILSMLFIVGVLFNAHAYSEEKNSNSIIDGALISDWANSALIFNSLNQAYDLEALGFPISNENISPSNTPLMNKLETHQVAVIFENDAFSAQSGFLTKKVDQVSEQAFFIQGSYRVLQEENFTLLVTAKIESLNEHFIYQFYSNDFVSRETVATNATGSKSYARFGILGQYSINSNWYLTGGLTSTAHEESSNSLPVYNMQKEQVAVFGTTYTF
jgi:hypothetical protein